MRIEKKVYPIKVIPSFILIHDILSFKEQKDKKLKDKDKTYVG
jgi:hypothetical protein